jgi:hypothetical protein
MTEENNNPGRGGKREGAGRKKKTRIYSDRIKLSLMKALKAKEKDTGKCWLRDLVDMNQDPSVQDSVRIAAKKLISDMLVIRESHRTDELLPYGVVILPKMDDDPAQVDYSTLPEGGKKKKGGGEDR